MTFSVLHQKKIFEYNLMTDVSTVSTGNHQN